MGIHVLPGKIYVACNCKVNEYLFRESNTVFSFLPPFKGVQLFKKRTCSLRNKFFLIRVDPILAGLYHSRKQIRSHKICPTFWKSRLQQTTFVNIFPLFFRDNKTWYFMWFTWNIKSYFFPNTKVKILKCCLLQFLFGALRVNPITTTADGILKHFFIIFLEKIRLDISCESSAR